jgi:dienelactone hydrolase
MDGGDHDSIERRVFLKTAALTTALPFCSAQSFTDIIAADQQQKIPMPAEKSLIGSYGPWAASLLPKLPPLSFRNDQWKDLIAWKEAASSKTRELVASPARIALPKVTVIKKYNYDGLEIEELSWQLPYGRPTNAVLLKPQGTKRRLPGILALHDHAAKKYFGYRKIVRTSDEQHPLLRQHQEEDYNGRAWANEVAKRGYVVLVHDAFAFGSRRVFFEDVKGLDWGEVNTTDKSDLDPEKTENIETYNKWSSEHEHVMAKSLFSAGTTWPGVFLSEDQTALDILSGRAEVDPDRIGCGGLSGGGLRTVYLAGLDARIKAAVCVGFMTTWKDLIMNKSVTHTWMTYTPLLPKYLDFPEILGLRVPLPTLVLNNNQDELYTLSEMKEADQVLSDVYRKANAPEKYAAKFYDGRHKFDVAMQEDAFNWFDKWL